MSSVHQNNRIKPRVPKVPAWAEPVSLPQKICAKEENRYIDSNGVILTGVPLKHHVLICEVDNSVIELSVSCKSSL